MHTFVTIADTGSLQGAAKQVHISQPALSLKLKTLEEVVGHQLFTRSKKGVELTQAGHNLYRFSKKLLNDAEVLTLAMRSDESRIRVGTFDVITQMIAPELCRIEKFVDLSFRTERSGLVLLDALDKDEIDIAIVDDPPIVPGFEYQKLSGSPFALFATKAFAKSLPQSEVALLKTLQHAPLIYIPGGIAYEHISPGKNSPKNLIDASIKQLGLGSGKRIRVDSFVTGINLTLQGHGIGLLLIGHLLSYLRSGELVELAHKELPMPFSSMLYMVTKTSRDKSQIDLALSKIAGVFADAVAAYQVSRRKR